MKFKKGAFISERRCQPLILKYKFGTVSPAYDIIEFMALVIIQLSWSCITCNVIELPEFEPNEYLFETFKDKGKERWEIYAWAVREIMKEAGDLQDCTIPLREKMVYEGYM